MIESLVIIVSAATGSGDCWRIIGSQVPVIISLLFAELFTTTPTPHSLSGLYCQGYSRLNGSRQGPALHPGLVLHVVNLQPQTLLVHDVGHCVLLLLVNLSLTPGHWTTGPGTPSADTHGHLALRYTADYLILIIFN